MEKPKKPGLLLISVGSILSSMVISGFVLGYATDVWLDTKPIFMLSLGFLGILGGTLKAFKLLTHPGLF